MAPRKKNTAPRRSSLPVRIYGRLTRNRSRELSADIGVSTQVVLEANAGISPNTTNNKAASRVSRERQEARDALQSLRKGKEASSSAAGALKSDRSLKLKAGSTSRAQSSRDKTPSANNE